MKKKTTPSSANVFSDLGFEPAEAAVLQLRANLMSDLRLYYIIVEQSDSNAGRPTPGHCPISGF